MRLVYLLFILALFGCSSQKQIAKEEPVVVAPAPSWVVDRPMSSSYYVGVGSAPITSGTQYMKTAKENALSDLASEIKVNVNSNSLLYTLERTNKFEQEYKETIQARSNLDLEGFELVDSYQDGKTYYTYYRLDKAEYARQVALRKKEAQTAALDYYEKGIGAIETGSFSQGVHFYMKGLQALEKFWSEENTVVIDGKDIQLDNALYSNLVDLISNTQLSFNGGGQRTYHNGFIPSRSILATPRENVKLKYSNVPLRYEYDTDDGKSSGRVETLSNGTIDIRMADAKSRGEMKLNVAIDKDKLFAPFYSDLFLKRIIDDLNPAKYTEDIGYIPAATYIESSEMSQGKKASSNQLSNALKSSLSGKGVHIVDQVSKADVKLLVETDTRPGNSAYDFVVVYLDYEIEVVDVLTGDSKMTIANTGVKGVDVDAEKAELKAYSNLSKNIDFEIVSKLKNHLY